MVRMKKIVVSELLLSCLIVVISRTITQGLRSVFHPFSCLSPAIVETMTACTPGYYPCASPPKPGFQTACIEASQFCDSKVDCVDGSDENECNFANGNEYQSPPHNIRTQAARPDSNSPVSTYSQTYGKRDVTT